VWGGAKLRLQALKHDVIAAADWDKDPGDAVILQHAHEQNRILITLDKDFGELAIVHEIAHSGIIRLHGFPARSQADVCHEILTRYRDELIAGAIVTADPKRVRVRTSKIP
jgi:predicted nuclease of predicted toxin-antitoxin system